ncbi:MAG: PA0069 family radical SAM protein [Gammaproteobacteria bacterium]|nr:PA0069 family radical SAM protein [Gammaproteobacteria bacterium]
MHRARTRKGRGAVSNESGRFEVHTLHPVDDGWHTNESQTDSYHTDGSPSSNCPGSAGQFKSSQIKGSQSSGYQSVPTENGYEDVWSITQRLKTEWQEDKSKTIITRNRSPDIHFDRSLNPYRGCEHGCIYCFARPTHSWLGHSAGLDFETKLYAKLDAATLLKRELAKPGYQCEPIAIGVNTDAYQPLERKLKLTRQVLSVLSEARHPAYLITKSSLIERDIDILKDMSRQNLVSACVSITTLNPRLARKLEPRATSPHRRLKILENLSKAGIPTRVSISPVIPALNEEEIDNIVAAAADAGAVAAYAIALRLPHELQTLFPEWLQQHYPLRAARVLKAIRSMRNDRLNNAEFGHRMVGAGPRADIIQTRFQLACKRANIAVGRDFELNKALFQAPVLSEKVAESTESAQSTQSTQSTNKANNQSPKRQMQLFAD